MIFMDKRSSKTILKIYQGFSLCLAEKRFEDVNVRDIIKASSVSTTGFYAHFKSKEDVLQGLAAKLFLAVKVRGGIDLESRLSLLFFRAQTDSSIWCNVAALESNASYLRNFLFPWCKSFLGQGKDKTSSKLSAELLVSALLLFMASSESKSPEELSKSLVGPLSLLLGA